MGSFGLILDVQQAGNDVQFDASTDSQASFSTVSDWLNRCLTTHKICHMNSSATPPTRVVYIPESGKPRLLVTNENTLAFLYTTLSHCWGSHMPLRLTTGNIEELQAEIPVEKLSKTFQDALEITKRMGLKHIWIDSLCVLQAPSQIGSPSLHQWPRSTPTRTAI